MNLQNIVSNERIKHLMSYFVVGLLATLVEWGSFWVLDYAIGIQYLIATIIAMIISTFSNWLFGRLLTFRNAEKGNTLLEVAAEGAVQGVVASAQPFFGGTNTNSDGGELSNFFLELGKKCESHLNSCLWKPERAEENPGPNHADYSAAAACCAAR